MRINEYEFTAGADPEIAITHQGKLVSAYGLIPGDKVNPFPVTNGKVQVDGMLLEFNIDPASDNKTFQRNLTVVMEQLKRMTPNHEFFKGCVAEFGEEYIESQPEEAKELGCMPDFNAYTGKENPRPNANAPFRTAGGHIHIGWRKIGDPKWPDKIDPMNPGHFEACCNLTKVLDLYLGIPSLVWDRNIKRRTLYGAPGCFRPKEYGMEYRSLSNEWLFHESTRELVFHNTMEAITELFRDDKIINEKFYDKTPKQIIEENDTEAVRRIVYSGKVKGPKVYRELLEKKAA